MYGNCIVKPLCTLYMLIKMKNGTFAVYYDFHSLKVQYIITSISLLITAKLYLRDSVSWDDSNNIVYF